MSEVKTLRPHRMSPKFFAMIPGGKGESKYNPFPMQKAIHYSKALYRVACLGRQVGKSELAAVEAAFELCTNPLSEGWIVAPTFDQAEIIFGRTLQKVQGAVEKPEFAHLKLRFKKGAKLEIYVEHYDRDWRLQGAKLVGTAKFKGKSGKEPDNLVGATLTYLIVDEAAVLDERAWTQALQPMLSTTQGWVLFISTPRGFNWFYELYMQGQSNSDQDKAWESFNAPSWDANPSVPKEWYSQKKITTPDLEFRQEFGAEFVSNSGSVFQGVDSVRKIEPSEHLSDWQLEQLVAYPYNKNHVYVMGADFGRLQDYTVYTVIDLNTREMVASYRYSYVDWEQQLRKLKEISDRWGGARVVGDNNGVGDFLEQECHKLGIPFEGLKFTGTQVKNEVINHLAIGLEQNYIAILDDPNLIKELRLYKYKRTESGQLTMAAEGRSHDDRVISLALAYSKVEHVGLADEIHNPQERRDLAALDGDTSYIQSFIIPETGDMLGLGDATDMSSLNDLEYLNSSLLRM